MKSGQVFTTICIACCFQAAIGNPQQPITVAPSNTDMSLNVAPDNIRTSLNMAPNNTDMSPSVTPNNTSMSPNVASSDMSDVDTLWFLLDTVLSSFMVAEKNNQGTGTLMAFGYCQEGFESKTINGKAVCVPKPDNDYD